MSGERRGLSTADQEKIGTVMAEVFAKAREAEEFAQLPAGCYAATCKVARSGSAGSMVRSARPSASRA